MNDKGVQEAHDAWRYAVGPLTFKEAKALLDRVFVAYTEADRS